MKVLDLADLAEHGFIEHDASLTRRDARKGDAVERVKPLLDQLLSLSADGKTLTRDDLAVAHQLRMTQSGEGGHRVPLKAALLGGWGAILASAAVIAVIGNVPLFSAARRARGAQGTAVPDGAG